MYVSTYVGDYSFYSMKHEGLQYVFSIPSCERRIEQATAKIHLHLSPTVHPSRSMIL
jgi:hypothetical protein